MAAGIGHLYSQAEISPMTRQDGLTFRSTRTLPLLLTSSPNLPGIVVSHHRAASAAPVSFDR